MAGDGNEILQRPQEAYVGLVRCHLRAASFREALSRARAQGQSAFEDFRIRPGTDRRAWPGPVRRSQLRLLDLVEQQVVAFSET